MDIELPSRVRKIISTLEDQGYEAFAVGGCVRDVCLGKKPSDWDITTSAPPLKVKEMFSHTVDTGLKHGTVTVVMGQENFEVTTYRIDGAYEDMRHPKEVTFTTSLSEDLKRRDFTINAMAYNERQGIIDLFGGERIWNITSYAVSGSRKKDFMRMHCVFSALSVFRHSLTFQLTGIRRKRSGSWHRSLGRSVRNVSAQSWKN